jgi:enamine deaminase RidA (YjgF/YER057c/UK114 family)
LFVRHGSACRRSGDRKVSCGAIATQTQQVMENLKLVLTEAGSGFDRVVMARIFLTDLRDYPVVNQILRCHHPCVCDEYRVHRAQFGLSCGSALGCCGCHLCGSSSCSAPLYE